MKAICDPAVKIEINTGAHVTSPNMHASEMDLFAMDPPSMKKKGDSELQSVYGSGSRGPTEIALQGKPQPRNPYGVGQGHPASYCKKRTAGGMVESGDDNVSPEYPGLFAELLETPMSVARGQAARVDPTREIQNPYAATGQQYVRQHQGVMPSVLDQVRPPLSWFLIWVRALDPG